MGLDKAGLDSHMLAQVKSSCLDSVTGPETRSEKLISRLRPHVENALLGSYNKRRTIFSPAFLPDSIAAKAAKLAPDIIHLHWIGQSFLRPETIAKLPAPVLWTLHDQWAFTGGCHYTSDCRRYEQSCGKCPVLNSSSERDLSRRLWTRKAKAWRGDLFHLVCPSRWLADCVRSSSLFANNAKVHVIPNGLDTERFKPLNKRFSRDLLQLKQDKKYILFGARDAVEDQRKGFDLLAKAVERIHKSGAHSDITLLVFGSTQLPKGLKLPFETLCFGTLHDEYSLVALYSAADVMVVPSLQEAFGQTASEAMACGTPVVAFGATGLLDIVEHQKTGYLAMPYSDEELAAGIQWVLSDKERYRQLGQRARESTVRSFALPRVLQQYANVYAEVLQLREPIEIDMARFTEPEENLASAFMPRKSPRIWENVATAPLVSH
jgi:glycosyltransferase involved in cell wall biosynthesis